MVERLDNNNNGALDRQELSRGGRRLGQIAGRYVEREGIDVKTELAKLEKSQGEASDRFDAAAGAAGTTWATRSRPGSCSPSSTQTPTASSKRRKCPEPLREPIERLMRHRRPRRDGRLSRDGISSTATERIVASSSSAAR